MPDTLRTAVSVPTFGDFDARTLGELARAAEDAGWDGFFCWDHVLWDPVGRGVADTTVALAAIALATSRVRFGPLVTPLARRRPWKVAREVASLDRLSGGRFTLGVGNGDDIDFAPVGDPTPARDRAAVLDESLGLLQRLLEEGGPVSHAGAAYRVTDVELHAGTVQPHVPVWVAGRWPHRRPLRRAARYDGVVPLWPGFALPTPKEYAACLEVVREERLENGRGDEPFDALVWSRPDVPDDDRLAAYAEVGATWWVEAFDPHRDDLDVVRRRIEAGPRTGG
ncbi:LLM class flavin-dependent oxidoreductase [Nocardioides ungokensis]|uniref:LLM class flavin-dependent oxidoreductase n=1 Tax=Nocardioides ungokensis TaxID=1643322 RepID=UPI001C60FB53|nr:LLM class flavin-dependent oxidoreductase [Nocardioides ungokensis]